MVNNLAVAVLGGLSLLIVSCSDNAGQADPDDQRAVRTHTEVIQLTKVSDRFQASGTIRAKTSTVLSSKVVGQILSLNVREGDRVRQGQVMAEIEDREMSVQLRRAQAGVTEAQRAQEEADRSVLAAEAAVRAAEATQDLALSTRKRYDVLRNRNSVSPQEYDEVETRNKAAAMETERVRQMLAAAKARRLQISARIEQAEAEVDAAQVALGYSRIVSPIDGIVTTRHIEPGMLATPGMPLLAIEDDRTYELEVAVEESRAPIIVLGQATIVEIDAIQRCTMDGRVREIVPSSDPATRTYTVKVQLLAPTAENAKRLRSGLFGRAFFPAGEREALVVPESALVHRGQLDGVYIVDNDVALLRLVKTGKRYGETVELLSGLGAGTRILTAPPADVADGVKIIDDESSRKTP